MGRDVATVSRRTEGSGTIPSLDGLRAVSIILVVLSHLQGTVGFPTGLPGFLFEHGTLGVDVFFVISGFLITTLLLRERESAGQISLRLFYARRAVRIFPAFYLFLFIVLVANRIGAVALPEYNLLYAASYTMNFVREGAWQTGHLWSLSVEEQFYLAWPLVMKVTSDRRALVVAGGLAILSPVAITVIMLLAPTVWDPWYLHTLPLVADSIAAGCVLAGLLFATKASTWWRKGLRERLGGLAPVAVLAANHFRGHGSAFLGLWEFLTVLGICYSVARYSQFPDTLGGTLLNVRPLVWIGKRSYSIYLWQQLFLNRHGVRLAESFPINLVAALACAMASYGLVERPLLDLRARMRRRVILRASHAI